MVAYRLYENRKKFKKSKKIDKKADFSKKICFFLYIKIRFPSFSNKLQEIQLSEYQIHHLWFCCKSNMLLKRLRMACVAFKVLGVNYSSLYLKTLKTA